MNIRLFKSSLCCFLACFLVVKLHAQEQVIRDSLAADSTEKITTTYILQQKEQQRVDSLVAMGLKTELQQVTTDVKRRKELEDKLKEIAQRDSSRKAFQQKKLEQLKKNSTGFPVTLLTDTLFNIYANIGAFNAEDRAKSVSDRIEKMYDDVLFSPDSLSIIQNELSYDIVYNKNFTIMSITDLDALWYNKSSAELSKEYLNTIKDVILKEKDDNSVKNWLKRIGFTLIIILGIWLIIYGINHLFRYLSTVFIKKRHNYFKGFKFRNTEILSSEQHYSIITKLANLVRIAIIILALYLALPLLFSIFPQTKPFADTLLGWVLTPAKVTFNGIINFLPNFFTIIVIYTITSYLLRFIKYFASEIDKGAINVNGFYRDWAWPTFNIARVLIYALMFVVIFPYLPGSHSPAFQGVTVFLGVLVSLGSSSAISNLVAGLVITYMRPFKTGDRVKIGEVTGDVTEKTLLVTRIRTIKNEDITVPNSTILNSYTINYSANTQQTGLILHTTVTIGYDVPWKDMHQALIDAALRTEFIMKEPQPFVLQTSLEDFYVSYQLNAYTLDANKQAFIYSELHKNIQDVCNERGIEIMSPHYNAMRDGNTTTIPADYLNKNYKSPGFNVRVKKEE